jgi:WD40 repeat protein
MRSSATFTAHDLSTTCHGACRAMTRTGAVKDAGFSPDGKWLASASADQTVQKPLRRSLDAGQRHQEKVQLSMT